MQSALDELKKYTTVVADTGDFELINQFKPQDATTNPSLILKSAKDPKYQYLIDSVVSGNKNINITDVLDSLLVEFGCKILEIVPGRVSTEVDARYSFDATNTINKAQKLISMYEKKGISRERVLIKVASTWEGICAAKELGKNGIYCNLTLLFSDVQAIACAEAKVTLISPFVGRILDWYKKNTENEISPQNDPGVLFVKNIYNYYKYFDYKTEVMGASFRNIDEIFELAGCDLLTISPKLLDELTLSGKSVVRNLSLSRLDSIKLEKKHLDEKSFRFLLNENQMATEKLSEGIRLFVKDTIELENIISEKIS